MPILLQINATDNASANVHKVTAALGELGTKMDQAGISGSKYQAAMLAQEAAMARLESVTSRYGSALASEVSATMRAAQAQSDRASALQHVADIQARVTSGLTTQAGASVELAAATARLASADEAVVSTQAQMSTAIGRTTDKYAALIAAQGRATVAQEKLNLAGKGGGGSSGGSGHSLVTNFLQYGVGYGLGFAALGATKASITRSDTFSRGTAAVNAETNLTPAESRQLAAMDMAQAGQQYGPMPYQANILQAGQYSLESLGIGAGAKGGMAKAVFDISTVAAQMSGAANAPDTSQATDTLTSLIADFGQTNSANVVDWTKRAANAMQVAVRVGKAEMPALAAQVAVPATIAAQLGVGGKSHDPSDLLNYIASMSAAGDPTGRLGDDLKALLMASTTVKKNFRQQQEANALGLGDNAGTSAFGRNFWGTNNLVGGSAIIEQKLAERNITGADRQAVLQNLFGGNAKALQAFNTASAGGLYSNATQMAAANTGTGAVTQAFESSQAYTGMQMQDAMTKLATGFDHLTTAALPTLTTAAMGAAEALNLIALGFSGPGGKGGWRGSIEGMTDTAMHFLRPGSGSFGNLDKSKQLAGYDQNPDGTFTYHSDNSAAWLKAQQAGTSSAPSQVGTVTMGAQYGAGWYGGMGLNPNAPGNHAGYAPGTYEAASRPSRDDIALGAFTGPMGSNSDAVRVANQIGRGGVKAVPQQVQEALARLHNAEKDGAPRDTVESALGLFNQVLKQNAGVTYNSQNANSLRLTALTGVQKYEAGQRAPGEQDAITSAKSNYDLARTMGETPAQLKAVFDQYIAAERAMVADQYANNPAALSKKMAAINGQDATFNIGQRNQAATDAVASLNSMMTSGGFSKNQVDSQLANVKAALAASTDTPGKQADIMAKATKAVGIYDRSLNAPNDQLNVSDAQGNLTLAKAMNDTPTQLKAIFDQYIAAERTLLNDTTAPGSLARAKGNAAIQREITTFGIDAGNTAMNRKLKDLQDQVGIDKALNAPLSKQQADQKAVTDFQAANAQHYGYNAQDIALMRANDKAALMPPVVNTRPFYDQNPGLSGFQAGPESTAVRIGGAEENPLVVENRALRAENTRDNAEIIRLLAQLVAAGIKPNVAPPARPQR